jgi:hypothetical protein
MTSGGRDWSKVSVKEPTAIFPPLIANIHASDLLSSEHVVHDPTHGTYGVSSSSTKYGDLVDMVQTYDDPLCKCITRHDESSDHDDDDPDFVPNDPYAQYWKD